MKKKIFALLAAIAAVLGMGAAATGAVAAEPYAPTIQEGTISYDPASGTLTVEVNSNGAVSAGYKYVYVQYDSHQISAVRLAADYDRVTYVGEATADTFPLKLTLTESMKRQAGSVTFKVYLSKVKYDANELLRHINDGTVLQAVGYDENGKVTPDGALTFTIPAVGENPSTGGAESAHTGAAAAPYVAAVMLLAAAGMGLFLVRRRTSR